MPLSIVTAGLSMGKHWAKEVACLAGAWKQRAQETNIAEFNMSARKKGRARETRVSPSRAPVLFCDHFFQAPATQATKEGSAQCKEIWIPETGNFACRIRNTGLWNPKYSSTTPNKEFGIKYPDYGIQDVESRIQDFLRLQK